ncbi:MAG: ExbD/TolR family protein [Opitutales bacterium]
MRTPLGVLEKVQPAEGGLSLLGLTLAATALSLTALLASPLAYCPGITVGFDERRFSVQDLSVAKTPTPDLARVGSVATLVSARGTGTYVIEGRIVQGREALLAEFRRIAANPARRDLPVLVKADKSQTMQGLADVFGAARAAGFPGILLATDPR